MRKYAIVAVGLLLSLVLGATLFREPIAFAAQAVLPVFVTNDASQPVPVHEQGTAQVAGTVGLSASANSVKIDPTNDASSCASSDRCSLDREIEASLIILDLQANVVAIRLADSGGRGTLRLSGPAAFVPGQSHYVLPLTQPIRVKSLDVFTDLLCTTQCFAGVDVAGTTVP